MFSEYKPVIMCRDCLCWNIIHKKCLRFYSDTMESVDCNESDFCSHGMCHKDEVNSLKAVVPDVNLFDIPASVWSKVSHGTPLVKAYTEWENNKSTKGNV